MPAMSFPGAAVLSMLVMLPASAAAADGVVIPAGVATHPDGRAPIEALYRASLALVEKGWTAEVVATSSPPGTTTGLPIIALRSPKAGPAVWILAGIHGEEPAGPNAVAATIDELAKLAEHRAVVLLPLLNPQGYARNWRYLNVATYSETVDGQSVGDSTHVLLAADGEERPRAAAASSPEAQAISEFILRTVVEYPPALSIDLHEDNLIARGYVYSQGACGSEDPLAAEAIGVLDKHGIPVQLDGKTRFGEAIAAGIIGPVVDGSIDDLMSARTVWANGDLRPGPAAHTVLVFETPAADASLTRRVEAHSALLRHVAETFDAMGRPTVGRCSNSGG